MASYLSTYEHLPTIKIFNFQFNSLFPYNSIEKNKPSGVKGRFFLNFTICTTMGPGIKIDLSSFKK